MWFMKKFLCRIQAKDFQFKHLGCFFLADDMKSTEFDPILSIGFAGIFGDEIFVTGKDKAYTFKPTEEIELYEHQEEF